jgi:hypothetical protein
MRESFHVGLILTASVATCLTPAKVGLGDLRAQPLRSARGHAVRIADGTQAIFEPVEGSSCLTVVQPNAKTAVRYSDSSEKELSLTLTGGAAPGLSISETYRKINPELIERTVRVTAQSDQRYYLDLSWKAPANGDFYSFTGKEASPKGYSPSCAGPEFGGGSIQTFPMLGCRVENTFYGLIGDTPGLWENRCFMKSDTQNRVLSLLTGDGADKLVITIPRGVDATSVYRAAFDGWQHIETGQTHTYKTWIFSSPVRSLYDIQLAAHMGLANAKGFNRSGLEAILRNTSYVLLRRNFLRPESDYIFISGVGYGWKQWVSDGFWMSRGLDDPRYDAEAHAAVFYERVDYEDNAQYYMIWSLMVKKAGGDPDPRTVTRAYEFIRKHEVDGLYVPPRLTSDRACMKTYHDQLPYDDDDAPSSNQGFHCGALMAARELGFKVTDEDINKAIAGYCRMFNQTGGYMATSLKQQQHVGQDSLYGEVLTFAVFGRKLLPDEIVRKHLETTMKIQTPYGMRVISKANGDLLDGHSGAYVWGGSWFLNDAANYLDGLIHGMDPNWVDDKLLWRLERELVWMPAFHESLNTKTGRPYGHHLYSWNSGFWWLRREVRAKLGMKSPDPIEVRLDKALGVVHRDGQLALDPSSATLRPKE